MKFVKNNPSSWASEESYEIYSGSTLLYTGTGFANSETRTTEQCLTTSTNDQYTVKMIDSYGDSWYSGAYLAIYGKHGNIVFKNFLADTHEESYTFSLYYGVEQSATWKMVSGRSSSWVLPTWLLTMCDCTTRLEWLPTSMEPRSIVITCLLESPRLRLLLLDSTLISHTVVSSALARR